ncbi:MAG: hypothetical protein RIR26_1521 [Pseudomonadota bacterium]|jgi:hypothetical protein
MYRLVLVFVFSVFYWSDCRAEILVPDEMDLSPADDLGNREDVSSANAVNSKISVAIGQGAANISFGPPASGSYETQFRSTSFAFLVDRKQPSKDKPRAIFLLGELNSSFPTSARRMDTQAVSWVDLSLKLGVDWQREIQNGLVLTWAGLSGVSYERFQFPMGTIAFKLVPLGSWIRLERELSGFDNPLSVSFNVEGNFPIYASSLSKYPERPVGLEPQSNRVGLQSSGTLSGRELRFRADVSFSSKNDGWREFKKPYPHVLSLGWAQKKRKSPGFVLEKTSSGDVVSQESFAVSQKIWMLTWTESL